MHLRSRASRLAVALLCSLLFAFDATAAAVTRGPFLQLGSESSMTVVLLTDAPGLAKVRFGLSASALTQEVSDASATTEHVLKLSGLTPSTRYWYQVELDGQVVASGPDHTFRTHPVKGSPEPFRFIAWGDSGNGSSGQLAVAERLKGLNAEPAFGLILGDIIYPAGERENYDPHYFQPYKELIRRMVVWPTIGNHDMGTENGDPYLEAYYLPTNNPAKSELYHSWDYGNVHFVCLDTHRSGFTSGSAQLQWLAQDLAASNAQWKIVYFHVPPYSGGTHSDSSSVKNNILPVLEAAGVDLVFSGHSHVYERTFLLKANTIVQNHAATYDQRVSQGSLYVVSGTGGASGSLSDPNHPLMAFQKGSTLGASVIEVSGPVLRGYFLDSNNQAFDQFTLFKNNDTEAPRLLAARAITGTQVEVTFDEPLGNGATTASNYVIEPSVAVLSAQLQSDARTVRLTTAAHGGGIHRVSVANIQDTALPTPNVVAAGSFATYGLPNTLFPKGGTWRYRVSTSDLPADWSSTSFADASWAQGGAPLGYGESGLQTTVTMNGEVTLYARGAFEVAQPQTLEKLELSVRYDDGFVAYVNGFEVARRNVAANSVRTTPASASHEAAAFETIDISGGLSRLVAGKNVIAVELKNRSATSSDLVLDAEVSGARSEVAPPYVVMFSPANGAVDVAADSPVSAQVQDDAWDLDPSGITLLLNGEQVTPVVSGGARDRLISFAPVGGWAPGATVNVELRATNGGGAAMDAVTWSFRAAEAQVIADAGAAGSTDAGHMVGQQDGGAIDPGGSGGGAPVGCGCQAVPVPALLVAASLALGIIGRRRRG